jgi:RND family efflux transporter MFP subunit
MNDKVDKRRLITPRRLVAVTVIVGILAVVMVAYGIAGRNSEASHLVQWTSEQRIPSVTVIRPSTESQGAVLTLPGRLEAFQRAPIYARVSGYLKAWYTDIGARVKAGQVLAVIETPDLDQQFVQAKADLASARANEELARTTAERWQLMLKSDSVSQQTADEKSGDWATKRALVNSAAANVDRLQTLEDFKRIVAPFDGIVTSRSTDVGALIDAGGGNGPQLFTVSDVHRLRAYVNVPQNESSAIHPGLTAQLLVPGNDTGFTAKVESTSGDVNVQSGTLLVELSVDDNSGGLMPGDFVNVRFNLSASSSTVLLPASSLIFRSSNLQAAVVDPTNHVRLRTVAVKRDLGQWIEVSSGFTADDRIVDTPPDALADGDEVRVVAVPATPTAGR